MNRPLTNPEEIAQLIKNFYMKERLALPALEKSELRLLAEWALNQSAEVSLLKNKTKELNAKVEELIKADEATKGEIGRLKNIEFMYKGLEK